MPVEYKDYYKTLGVKQHATAADIKEGKRKVGRQYHPDIKTSADSTKKFKEVNEANEVRSDPEKRKKYDQLGPDWERYAQAGPRNRSGRNGYGYTWSYSGTRGANPFEGDEGGFSDFFQSIFGNMGGFEAASGATRRRASRPPRRAQDMEMEHPLEVTLAEAYKGAERVLELQGEDGKARRLTAKIPPAPNDRPRIRLAGQAHAGSKGGPAGAPYLPVSGKPGPRFARAGA